MLVFGSNLCMDWLLDLWILLMYEFDGVPNVFNGDIRVGFINRREGRREAKGQGSGRRDG